MSSITNSAHSPWPISKQAPRLREARPFREVSGRAFWMFDFVQKLDGHDTFRPMRINLTDPRLSPTERLVLQQLRDRLSQPPRAPLPEGYEQALRETFGSCGEGETDRWHPMPAGDSDVIRQSRSHVRGEDHPKAKLTDEVVRVIRGSGDEVRALARQFVDPGTIRATRNRRTWRHV